MSIFKGVALITGAASGIGQTTAFSFAREGCRRLVLADRDTARLEETQKALSKISQDIQAISVPTDISQEKDIEKLYNTTINKFGRVDYVVNAAGILGGYKTSHETSAEEFDRINGVNYRGSWLSSRAAIRNMIKQEPLPTHDGRPGNRGSIVNISSALGATCRPAAHVRTILSNFEKKAHTNNSCQYAKHLIRVNSVLPGLISTPLTEPYADLFTDQMNAEPEKRMGTSQEIADAVLFLSSSKATYVQGISMMVDGGYIFN
ncbi:hypothetical protein F66182_811 [Fusarium sp. NRRL 66182]|nr:hypothetical protein F66182_811 [Fusarium sp. NRRL 66182]